ncbi:MAG TPA: aminopeptidase P N-terminal domain-containing protein [Pyrinomonadaceae bacterium]|jgi:Xaa-Pro aminopeptidase
MKKNIISLISLCAFSLTLTPIGLRAETLDTRQANAIRVAPPAPVFTDAERQNELARRRAAVAKKMSANSILMLWSAAPRNYGNDVDFYYRQENDLYYLTNLKQINASLVLVKDGGGSVQEYLFLPKRDPARETWTGKMYSREEATRISGLKTIVDAAELEAFKTALGKKQTFTSKDGSVTISTSAAQNLYLLLPRGDANTDPAGVEYARENDYSKTLTGYQIQNARPIFDAMRQIKSAYELKLMQHAMDITTEAHMRSMAIAGRSKWEYEVQAEVEYTFRRRNADYWGYPSIVGCGPNATTLHYTESQSEVKPGSLILMDVGAEYDHYTADVTRTFPVNGKFTKEQADIYQIVFNAQEAAAKATKPGGNMGAPSKAAADVIKNGLANLGLITAPDATYQVVQNGQTMEVPQYRIWYMHGLGHWLGMNVHDVSDPQAPFKAGMIFTNEPGIYLREDALDYLADTPANKAFAAKVTSAFQRYKNIGVRIEDNMLVTERGVEWMTKNLPRKLEDVEAFMARASREISYIAPSREISPTLATFDYGFATENQFGLSGNFGFPSGITVRRGWIWSGRETAVSGLNHAGHSHGE